MTCFYEIVDEDDYYLEMAVKIEILEHEVIRVISADSMLSDEEIRAYIAAYCKSYGVTDVSATISLEGIERV